MKRNAIIRIIVWSLVLVVLASILIGAIAFFNIRSAYTQSASHKEMAPILSSSPDTVELVPAETVVSGNAPGEKTSFSAAEVREIEIDWVAGDILIQPGTTDRITVREDGLTDEKYAMVVRLEGDELNITFCEEATAKYFGINTRSDLEKDLTILVPPDWTCEALDISCASATLEVNDLTIREVDFDGASGTCEFENCAVGEMDVDTASGDVRFVGSLDMLDCDAASANVYAVLTNTPSRLDMDSMSGDLDITLPQDAGFALAMDGMNTNFESDFETTVRNGNYVCGDGRCRINVDAMSSDVIIRMDSAAGVPTTDHHHTHTDRCTTDPESCPDHSA